jgi:molecular chaperone DnaJ
VPVLGGAPVKLKVAPGTPSGRTLRVKGKGVQFGNKQGDLLATIEVVVPAHLPAKAKQLLEKFEEELPEEDPRADLLSKAGLL